jgi:hypothetical protein
MFDVAFWRKQLLRVTLPPDTIVDELAEAVGGVLNSFLLRRAENQRRDQINRFKTFWGVDDDWLDPWFEQLQLLGSEGPAFITWLRSGVTEDATTPSPSAAQPAQPTSLKAAC